jgi:hypothetical protein
LVHMERIVVMKSCAFIELAATVDFYLSGRQPRNSHMRPSSKLKKGLHMLEGHLKPELNGVRFAVLKRRVLQKRHRPPPDMTSGLSVDTAMYPHEYKNLHGNVRCVNTMNKKRKK